MLFNKSPVSEAIIKGVLLYRSALSTKAFAKSKLQTEVRRPWSAATKSGLRPTRSHFSQSALEARRHLGDTATLLEQLGLGGSGFKEKS